MEYLLLNVKKKKILPFTTVWIDLDNITLSEISHAEEDISYDFTHVWTLMNKQN